MTEDTYVCMASLLKDGCSLQHASMLCPVLHCQETPGRNEIPHYLLHHPVQFSRTGQPSYYQQLRGPVRTPTQESTVSLDCYDHTVSLSGLPFPKHPFRNNVSQWMLLVLRPSAHPINPPHYISTTTQSARKPEFLTCLASCGKHALKRWWKN
jgi:hypothetical protein